jgi:type VI secretion system protein VasG
MAEIRRSVLFGKLNSVGYKSLESATVFCKMRGNPYVELVHWLQQLLQVPDADVQRVVRHFGLDQSRLAKDITSALDRLPRGATSLSDLSAHIDEAMESAWVLATLVFGEYRIRTGHVLAAMVRSPSLSRVLNGISEEFRKIKGDDLADQFAKVTAGSTEESLPARDGAAVTAGAAPGEASGAMAPAQMGRQEALARFSVDLTEKARKGDMDPILGRDNEIRQVIDILMRRRQNNPILTGEAGVGKTAVVEGFAQRIVRGDVPPALKDVALRTLDVGLLQAGASMKGEFEQRLRQVIEEVQASPKPIILFIDEAHTLIGAGGSAGTGDAANLLKPALARGTLRTIAATTWAEYKKYIEKDPALTRRFQVVKVEEPSEEKTILMVRGLASVLEKHHRVLLLDEAIEAAARLSHRYIPARQLPDKAVSLLDTACARVAVSQHATPPEVEDSRRRIENLTTELGIIGRETAVGYDHEARRKEVEEAVTAEKDRLAGLEAAWGRERELVDRVFELRRRLRQAGAAVDSASGPAPAPGPTASAAAIPAGATPGAAPEPLSAEDREKALAELKELLDQLREAQGETPLILPAVDAQAVASVVADWTGIPVGRMVKNEIEAVLGLADTLGKRVIGQRHAMETIAKRIQTSRAGIDNPNRPIGVFMLVGPSGVGKTETALALAEALYGGEHNLITINMSEFQEAHTVSTLKGAPPGYVGYGEGGVLTEAVRRRPYSVVLLDEVEKAHPDVHEIFFQVFDKGWMEDGEGRTIDFKNTVILLTSNAGSELIMNLCKDPDLMPAPEGVAKALREPLLKVFPAALLGRLVVVPFYPISDEMLTAIIRLQLEKIRRRLEVDRKVGFSYTPAVADLVKSRCTEVESGARMVDAILTHTVLPEMSREFLLRMVGGQPVSAVKISVRDGDFSYEFQ